MKMKNSPRARVGIQEWGEPYFARVQKLRAKVEELLEENKVLKSKTEDQDSEEARDRKMARYARE